MDLDEFLSVIQLVKSLHQEPITKPRKRSILADGRRKSVTKIYVLLFTSFINIAIVLLFYTFGHTLPKRSRATGTNNSDLSDGDTQ